MQITPITPINTYNTQLFKKTKFEKTSFTGAEKPVGKVTNAIANFIAKRILPTKLAKQATLKLKDSNLVSHLSVFTALVLSGFYIQQTLKNDNLEKKKRNTLAINQALVAIVSTVCGYTVDKATDKKVNQYIDKFKLANAASPKLTKYVDGINVAKKLMIFGTMYRFIAPVIVTPFANWIGNKIAEPKQNKLVKTA